MLRSCDEVPAYNTPSGKSCVSDIANKFVYTRTLGQGKQGIAFEVVNEQQKMVVKVVPLEADGIREVESQCLLNDLSGETGVFTRSFGWQVCSEMPSQWAEFVRFPAKERLLFIFMEKSMETWKEMTLKPSEKKAALFIMLHGIMTARKAFNGFNHDDIHAENVMLQPIEMDKIVNLGGGYSVGPGLRFVPKFIDFGYTYIGFEDEEDDQDEDDLFGGSGQVSTDIGSIEFLMGDDFAKFFATPEFARARQSDLKDYQSLQILLDMPFFKEFKDTENRPVNSRCSVCSSSMALYRWKNPQYKFCSMACGNLWGQGIGEFIK